jgi:hypothetical protein
MRVRSARFRHGLLITHRKAVRFGGVFLLLPCAMTWEIAGSDNGKEEMLIAPRQAWRWHKPDDRAL